MTLLPTLHRLGCLNRNAHRKAPIPQVSDNLSLAHSGSLEVDETPTLPKKIVREFSKIRARVTDSPDIFFLVPPPHRPAHSMKTWGAIPQSVINNFVGSFPDRVKKCAAGQGRIVVKL